MIVPAFLRLPLLPLLLSLPADPPPSRVSPWWMEVRMASPGAAFLRSGVAFSSGPSSTTWEVRWVPGGTVETSGSTVLPLDVDRRIALGLSASVGEAIGVRFGLALDDGKAFEVQWPILQHPAMPLRPVWRAAYPLDFGRGASGAVFGGWSPGRLPHVLICAERDGWTMAIGSGGVQLSRIEKVRRLPILWRIGWMRSSIPWAGAMVGSAWSRPPVEFPASPIWVPSP